jgi:hypothetical protein
VGKNEGPGRAHRNEYRSFALSKDGSMILDDGRRTAFQLFMIFSEDGGRTTVNVSLRSSDLLPLPPLTSGLYQGRVHDLGRWTKDVSSALNALSKDGLLTYVSISQALTLMHTKYTIVCANDICLCVGGDICLIPTRF